MVTIAERTAKRTSFFHIWEWVFKAPGTLEIQNDENLIIVAGREQPLTL